MGKLGSTDHRPNYGAHKKYVNILDRTVIVRTLMGMMTPHPIYGEVCVRCGSVLKQTESPKEPLSDIVKRYREHNDALEKRLGFAAR
jgi:hypothetical protein